MMAVHAGVAISTISTAALASKIETESKMCKFLFPMNELVYFVINLILIGLYSLSLVVKPAMDTLNMFKTVKIFGLILALFSLYILFLKLLSVYYCIFWTLAWSNVLFKILMFLAEGAFLFFYSIKFYERVEMVKKMIDQSAPIVFR